MIHDAMANPAYGVTLTIGAYILALKLYNKFRSPLFNPNLVGSATVILIIIVGNIPYEMYKAGGKYIGFLLELSMVALAVPLYKNLDFIKRNFSAIFAGILCGAVAGIISAYVSSLFLGAEKVIALSMAPKSVTTPIGKGISRLYGGFPAITHAAAVASGALGMMVGPDFLRTIGVKHPMAHGLALGTGSHGLGTSRAVLEGDMEGAMSGLAMGMAGIITALVMPLLLKLLL